MSDLSEKAIEIAISQLGKQEVPHGSNWGEPVKTYLASVGINFPAPWCMAFVHWCFDQAAHQMGVPNPLFRTGGVLDHWNRRRSQVGHVQGFQRGDIFIMDHGKGLGHTGIIESVEGNTLHTIEGNTNDTGSREGYEVCRKTRPQSSIIGVLRY
jgi:hypothetical protein